MSAAIGISLGSKRITAAKVVEGHPGIIASVPSVISITADGSMLVGDSAAGIKLKEPEHAISDIRRYIGRDPTDEQLQREAAEADVILAECDGQAGFLFRGKDYSAAHSLAVLFRALKQECESRLGEAVIQCAITHPTTFGMRQIDAIRQSADEAGLQPALLVNELIAIGLAYGLDENNKPGNTLVYHLGSSLSAGVLGKGSLKLIAHTSDVEIGGRSFDRAILAWIISQLRRQHDIDLPAALTWPQIRQSLLKEAESAKIMLSKSEHAVIHQDLPVEHGKYLLLDLELSRQEFEAMIAEDISKSLVRATDLLYECSSKYLIGKDDIDCVLLSGGSCQIPFVQHALEHEFGGRLRFDNFQAAEGRAIGAALATLTIEPAPTFGEDLNPEERPSSYPSAGEDWRAQAEYQLSALRMVFEESGELLPVNDRNRLEKLGESLGREIQAGEREKSLELARQLETGLQPYNLFLFLGIARVIARRSYGSSEHRLSVQLQESLADADRYKSAGDYQRLSECMQDRLFPLVSRILQETPSAAVELAGTAPPPAVEKSIEADDWIEVRSLLDHGDLDKADQLIRQALEADPDQPRLKDLLAEITRSRVERLLEQESQKATSAEEALRAVDHAIAMFRDVETYVGSSHPYLDINSLLEMRQQLSASVEMFQKPGVSVAIEQANQAIQSYKPGVNYPATISQLDAALHDLEAANRTRQQEQLAKMIRDLREVCSKISTGEAAYLNHRAVELANAAMDEMKHRRNYEAAIKLREALGLLEQAIRIEPSDSLIRRNLDEIRNLLKVTGFEFLAPAYIRATPTETAVESYPESAHTRPPPPKARSARTGNPEMPASRVDDVHFTVTAPPEVLPGESFVLDVWAHLQRQRKEVIIRAQQAMGGGDVLVQSVGPVRLARGTVLRARLQIEGCQVEYPENTILWQGEIGNATFAVAVPKGLRTGALLGKVFIYADTMQVARIDFRLKVGKRQRPVETLSIRQARHRKAFASYAHEDIDGVLARIQGMQKVARDLEIFMDVLSLRSGQDWEHELWKVIPRSDIFFLFWSVHAKDSPWVEKEWRCAYEKKGIHFIDPVPLVHPDQAPPPPELAGKHFNDWVLAFQRSQS